MKTILLSIFFSLFVNVCFAQTVPTDSLYLGQTAPGDIPKVFKLRVSPEHFAAERISISNDGKEIFYSEIKSYYPINSARIKNYRYTAGKWTGPFVLFEGYCAPALSITSDTMFFENETFEAYYSIKDESKWSIPRRILSKPDSTHYLQVTNRGNYYISSNPQNTIGLGDWCKLDFKASDTTAVGLGMPLNTAWDNLDFFVSREETFMIVTTPFGLSISYPKKDGSWTNPRNLGDKINFGLAMWGPYVPYAKNKIKSPNGFVGHLFNFTVPDDTFFDEDGDSSFTYSATQIDGSPLPFWLSFNALTKTFSGTPKEASKLRILITATDTGYDSGIGAFQLIITDKP